MHLGLSKNEILILAIITILKINRTVFNNIYVGDFNH